MYNASRPLEYICFYPDKATTQDAGDVYAFIFMDVFSEFVFMTGFEKSNSQENILKHIRLLTRDKDFLRHKGLPFTLVMHGHEEITEDILHIIKPLKGKVLVDDAFVEKQVAPFLKTLHR
jgi:hypothetical protein